jgi:predicted permease
MSTLLQDLRYALRALANRPLHALVTVLVLALAIGANTTVFSVFNGFYLRPLPYPDDGRLVTVYNVYPKIGLEFAGTSIPDYLDRRDQAPSLESLAIYNGSLRTLQGGAEPQRLNVIRSSPSLFDVLAVAPLLGRTLGEEEAKPGNDHAVVLSYALWNTRFGARAEVIGTDVRLDGEPYRVLGVMPQGFGFPNRDVDAWVPFVFTPEQTSDGERGHEFSGSIGRLRPGATVEGLNSELDAIVQRNMERLPQAADYVAATGFTGRAESLRETAVGDLERMVLILQASVLAVLLIACANVTNLQLARMASRRRELAVRAALGAGQLRLAVLVLVENLVLALAGAALGLLLAHAGLEGVRALGLDWSRQGFAFALDGRVVLFTAGIAALAGLTAALVPMGMLAREDLAHAIQKAGRLGGGAAAAYGLRRGLVVVQVAASVALLVGAGLLTKSFYELQRDGAGFDGKPVWTARIAVPPEHYPDDSSVARFYESALEQLRALPGVTAAGFTSDLPFSGGVADQGSYLVDGYEPVPGTPSPHGMKRSISQGYFPSLGIPVVEGRNFNANETERVAIVDELLAEKYWPNGSAVGQRLRNDANDEWYTIVGVVPTVSHRSLAEQPGKETIYWYYRQQPDRGGEFTLRTTLPPAQLARAAADAVLRVDPELPVFDAMSMEMRVQRSLGPQRAPMVLTLVFAAIAFMLAVIGIYGVLTWAVTQRVGEIGVRMAFGAHAADVMRMILGQGTRLIVAGLVFGIAGAVALARYMASLINNVSALDPAVFGIVLTGLTTAALLASWLPARRASRIDPMQALREE